MIEYNVKGFITYLENEYKNIFSCKMAKTIVDCIVEHDFEFRPSEVKLLCTTISNKLNTEFDSANMDFELVKKFVVRETKRYFSWPEVG